MDERCDHHVYVSREKSLKRRTQDLRRGSSQVQCSRKEGRNEGMNEGRKEGRKEGKEGMRGRKNMERFTNLRVILAQGPC